MQGKVGNWQASAPEARNFLIAASSYQRCVKSRRFACG